MMMKKKIPWFDMIGFYLVLPIMSGGLAWIFYIMWQEGDGWAYLVHMLFWCSTILLLCSSVGVFVVRLIKGIWMVILKVLHETWDEMVDSMTEAQK